MPLDDTNVISVRDGQDSVETVSPGATRSSVNPESDCVRVGLVAAPGAAADAAEAIVADVCKALGKRYPNLRWEMPLVIDALAAGPVPAAEIVEATRDRLLDEDWDLALAVIDLPLRVAGHPVADRSSPTHRVGVVSLPSLGPVQIQRRLRNVLTKLTGELLLAPLRPDGSEARDALITSPEEDEATTDETSRRLWQVPLYTARVVGANLRLFAGMIRANRPWRFTLRLYRVLVTALAAGVFAIITGEAWQLADALSWPRLAAASVVTVGITIAGVIGAHGLWERSSNPRTRQDVILFNLATASTVTLGISSLYVVLFGIGLGTSYLVVDPDVLTQTIGDPTGADTYVKLAWLLASVATLGGALGAGLESETSVREATYASVDGERG